MQGQNWQKIWKKQIWVQTDPGHKYDNLLTFVKRQDIKIGKVGEKKLTKKQIKQKNNNNNTHHNSNSEPFGLRASIEVSIIEYIERECVL